MKPVIRLLVVDDDAGIRALCQRGIGVSDAMAVDTAANGREALAKLEKERYDIVLTDLMMPEVDGFKVTETCRKKYSWTDVIVMTSFPTMDHVVKAIKLGASDFILKPMELLLLKAALRRVVERRALKARLNGAAEAQETVAAALKRASKAVAELTPNEHFVVERDACVSAIELAIAELQTVRRATETK